MIILTIFVALLFFYSLGSNALVRANLTAPLTFTVAGAATVALVAGQPDQTASTQILLKIAELGLVLLLFTDGTRISYKFKGGLLSLPGRLLSVGMLLTIAFGLLAALLLFTNLTFWQAGILAAVLAPTDAGLGQAIVSNEKLPRRIRESLNVEAGLNDGLAVPFLLFFMAMADGEADASFSRFLIEQLGYGVAIGLLIGRGGSELYEAAQKRGWIAPEFRQLGFAALPLMCMLAAEASGASMFIAAFVAGASARRECEAGVIHHSVAFTDRWGQLLNLSVFFLFGILAAKQFGNLEAIHFVYAAMSLTVVRMAAVAIAMTGSGLQPLTIGFMGWFGPRGLASVVLGLVYLEHTADRSEPLIHLCVIATVLSSIVLHGLTAKRGADLYASKASGWPQQVPEKRE